MTRISIEFTNACLGRCVLLDLGDCHTRRLIGVVQLVRAPLERVHLRVRRVHIAVTSNVGLRAWIAKRAVQLVRSVNLRRTHCKIGARPIQECLRSRVCSPCRAWRTSRS